MFRSAKFAVRLECFLNLRVEKRHGPLQRFFGTFPALLSHLRCCNLPKIDWIVRIIRPRPDGQVLTNLLEALLSFLIAPLRHVAIADVAVGEEEKLVFRNVEGGFLGERNDFGLVALHDFRRASALSLELRYSFVNIVELSLLDFFGGQMRCDLDRIVPHRLWRGGRLGLLRGSRRSRCLDNKQSEEKEPGSARDGFSERGKVHREADYNMLKLPICTPVADWERALDATLCACMARINLMKQ